MRSEPPRPRVATSPSGAAPIKPGTTGTTPAREQWAEHPLDGAVGAGVIGRRLAERGVGVDQVERVHVLGAGSAGLERGGDQPCAEPLAAGDEVVGGAGGQLAEQPKPLGQRLELGEEVGDVEQHVGAETAAGKERPGDFGVPGAEPRDERSDGTRLAGSRLLGHFEERVGGSRHRGDHDDGGLRAMAANDLDRVADGSGIGQRRTAELVHVWCSAGAWHGGL